MSNSFPFLLLAMALPGAVFGDAMTYTPSLEKNPLLPPGFSEMSVSREDGSRLHYYVAMSTTPSRVPRPLIIYLDGSGCNSQFFVRDKRLSFTSFGAFTKLAPFAVVAAPEKRGINFGFAGKRGSGEGCPDDYTRYACMETRLTDTIAMIKAVKESIPVSDRILIIGHSEGAPIAAYVAERLPEVTHVAFLSGPGASQIFDRIIIARKEARAEGKSAEEAEKIVTGLENYFRDILAHPDSIDKFFQGHTYKRWSGYISHPALESLMNSRARLFLAQGTEDDSTPVESFDAMVVEAIRRGRAGVEIHRIAGAGHDLRSKGSPQDGPPLNSIFSEVLSWFNNTSDVKESTNDDPQNLIIPVNYIGTNKDLKLAAALNHSIQEIIKFSEDNHLYIAKPENFVTKAVIYDSKADFDAMVKSAPDWPAGTTVPKTYVGFGQNKTIFAVSWQVYKAIHPDEVYEDYRKVIQHELVHLFHIAYLHEEENKMGPVWFYEGFACLVAKQYPDAALPSKDRLSAILMNPNRGDYRQYVAIVRTIFAKKPIKSLLDTASGQTFSENAGELLGLGSKPSKNRF